MSRGRLSTTVAIVAVSAGLAVPGVGLAAKGGHPHSTKPCPVHKHVGKHKGAHMGKKTGAAKGKKCGR